MMKLVKSLRKVLNTVLILLCAINTLPIAAQNESTAVTNKELQESAKLVATEVTHYEYGDIINIKTTKPVGWHMIRAKGLLILDLTGCIYPDTSKVKLILKGLIKLIRVIQLKDQPVTRVIVNFQKKDVKVKVEPTSFGIRIRLSSPEASAQLAGIQISTSNAQKASSETSVTTTNSIKKLQDEKLKEILEKAKQLYDEGKFAEVVELLVPAEETFKSSPELKTLLGKAYLKLGKYDEAAAEFEEVLKIKETPLAKKLLFLAVKKSKKPLCSLKVKNTKIEDALLNMLADYPYKIEVDKEANIPITVSFTDLTFEEAMKRTVIDNGLAYEIDGNRIHIFIPTDKLEKFVAKFEMRETPLIGALEALAKMLGINLIIDRSVYQLSDKTITLFIEDKLSMEEIFDITLKSFELEKIKYNDNTYIIVKKGDAKDKYLKRSVRIYRLKGGEEVGSLGSNQDTVKLLNSLIQEMQISDKELKLIYDERTKSLVAYGTEDKLKILDKLVQQLDVKVGQVVIAMKVLEVSKEGRYTLGVSLKNLSLGGSGSAPTLNTGGIFPIDIKTFGKIPLTKLDATVDLLETKNYVQTIASPILRTLNKQTATIHIGKTVPIKTENLQPIYEGGRVVGYATQVEWQSANIGINMEITPVIHNNNEVTLQINFEISDADLTNVEVGGHFVTTDRSINTVVRLKDGETIMLGGLVRKQAGDQDYRLPFFTKLPLIGKLFKYKNKNHRRDELVILLTAYVIPPENAAGTTRTVSPLDM